MIPACQRLWWLPVSKELVMPRDIFGDIFAAVRRLLLGETPV